MQANVITGEKAAERSASIDPAANSTMGASRPPASPSTVRVAVRKIQGQQLEILQDALKSYQDARAEIRVENISVAGKLGVVVLLPGVHFCGSCGSLSQGVSCAKCDTTLPQGA